MAGIVRYGVNFNGRRIVHPGAYGSINAKAMTIVTDGSTNYPIIVGSAQSGESGKVHWFTNASDLREYLTGGDLVTGAELLFSPTPEGGGGASVVGVLIANPTTQGSLEVGTLTVKSRVYGAIANRIQLKIESASGTDIPGTKRVSVYRWDTDELETYKNVGAVLRMKYTGEDVGGANVVVAKNDVSGKKELKVLLGADGSQVEDFSIELGGERFQTLNDVILHISSMSGYEVGFVDYKNASLPADQLDIINVSINTPTGDYLRSAIGDFAKQLGDYSELVTVSGDVESATTITDMPYTTLSGGSVGSVPISWANVFKPIRYEYSNILVALNDTEIVHAEALQHIAEMEIRQQPQVLFTGGGVGESVTRVKQRAALLNSSRAVIGYPAIYHNSVNNGKTVIPAYFTGALIAGRVCGVGPSDPVTFEYFNLVALEKNLMAGDSEIDDLITSGVATLERVQNGGIRLVQGITTYLSENNTLYREISVRKGADYLISQVREELELAFVGKKFVGADSVSSITTKVVDVLAKAIKDGHIINYRNIQVRFSNTVVYVDFEVAPSTPINYILITANFVPEIVAV